MKFIQANMTKGSETFTIKALDLMHGQAIRDRSGVPEFVSNVDYIEATGTEHAQVTFDLIARTHVSHLSIPQHGGIIQTTIPTAWTAQTGMDAQTMRCGTCDSRHCGHNCSQPYILDRA